MIEIESYEMKSREMAKKKQEKVALRMIDK